MVEDRLSEVRLHVDAYKWSQVRKAPTWAGHRGCR